MVLPDSHGVPLIPWYLGSSARKSSRFRLRGFHPLRLTFPGHSANEMIFNFPAYPRLGPRMSHNPSNATAVAFNTLLVWALPRSLVATKGIAFAFFSWGY